MKSSRLAGDIIRFLLAVCLFILLFPSTIELTFPGADYSWHYGLNYLWHHGYPRDYAIIYHYGPLLFLINTVEIGSNLPQAMTFILCLHLLFAGLLFLFMKRTALLGCLVFAAALILNWTMHCMYEYYLLFILALLFLTSWQTVKFRRLLVFLAGILGGVLTGIKFAMAFQVFSMLFFYEFCGHLRGKFEKTGCRPASVWFLAAYFSVVLPLLAMQLHSLSLFPSWLAGNWKMVFHYSVHGALIGPASILYSGLAVIAGYAALVALLFTQKSPVRYAALLLAGNVYFTFRHGFMRQDQHVFFLFHFVIAVTALLFLLSTDRRSRLLNLGALLIFAACAIVPHWHYEVYLKDWPARMLRSGWGHITNVLHLDETRNWLRATASKNIESERLPEQALKIIGDGTVDVLPWELTCAFANGLKWVPNPILQPFNVATRYQDRLCADHFSGPHAPGFLLVHSGSVDERNFLFDSPQLWRSVLARYEAVEIFGRYALFRKKDAGGQEETLQTVSEAETEWFEWVVVPSEDAVYYAKLEMELTLLGRLAMTFFRVPPVRLLLLNADGQFSSYRFIPDTAREGLLLCAEVQDMRQFVAFSRGTADNRIVKVRIEGGGWYYKRKIRFRWLRSSREIKYEVKPLLRVDRLASRGTPVHFHVDSINDQTPDSGREAKASLSREGEMLRILGWAIDHRSGRAAGGVWICVDGKNHFPAQYGLDRGDVAAGFSRSEYRYTGFRFSLPLSLLEKGAHTLTFKLVSGDGKSYYVPAYSINLDLK